MTACTNHGGKARRVVTAALVGVLSVGTVPMVALAEGVNDGIETLADAQDNWQGGSVTFDHEANTDGSYTVTSGDALSFVSATDASMNEYGPSDVTVLFFDRTANTVNAEPHTTTAVDAADTISGRAGSMPELDDTDPSSKDYWVVVFQGDIIRGDNGEVFEAKDSSTLDTLLSWNKNYKAFKLKVVKETISIEGASAFEFNASATDKGISDTEFGYDGDVINVAFQVNGNMLNANDYNIVWTSLPAGASAPTRNGNYFQIADGNFQAGTYKARLTAKGSYTGTAEVTFEVKGIDLSSASVYIAPAESFNLAIAGANCYLDNEGLIAVNGSTLLDNSDVVAELIAVNGNPNYTRPSSGSTVKQGNGMYTFKLTPRNNGNKNVTGEVIVDTYCVDNEVTYSYDSISDLSSIPGAPFRSFNAAKGTFFTTAALGATDGTSEVPYTVTVTKDGQAVTSYDEPGTYTLVLDTPVVQDSDGRYLYAGHYEGTFVVEGKDYSGAKVYVSYDGKILSSSDSFEYTGEAVDPTVVVRDAKGNLLTEGEDYTVKFTDAAGNEVEAATEVGTYKIEVTYAGTTDATTEKGITFYIDKANIVSGKATADFFGIPEDGSATPSFVGLTKGGQEFELGSDVASVRYYASKKDTAGKLVKDATKPVKAEDLTKEGVYFADINVLTTAKNIQGSGIEVQFTLSKKAVFADVDANAWYAQAVATAYKNWYVNGIAGTNLFAPEAQITRAEVVCILFNMAGGDQVFVDTDFSYSETQGYVTGFSDVDGHAYYAKALAWAHATGVVNGNGGKFMPDEKLTREQFAAMLANYAMSKGDYEASDGSALAALPDAGTVSDWATSAVAWAVDNGIMGNNGSVMAQNTITRGEVAAMAVNYQPEPIAEIKKPR